MNFKILGQDQGQHVVELENGHRVYLTDQELDDLKNPEAAAARVEAEAKKLADEQSAASLAADEDLEGADDVETTEAPAATEAKPEPTGVTS